ncbi:MAG TPA: winged helix-turn-helix domain-containing protein [Vicinamibacterales bacterium]|nr:winged helix-turn-helix domain-containing protein [Vicinamibacterales bacterium]
MDTQSESEGALRFGAFELDERAHELRTGSTRIRLQDQPFEILRLLVRRPGEVVTREELRRQLWPDGTYVDFEHSLNAAVKRLRAALGDDADNPRFVETLPRRGYRFVAATSTHEALAVAPQPRAPKVRLAVLPFSNLGDERHEYFGDGLHEELISQLGGLCRGRLGVLGRWSSVVFKGTPLRARDVGEALRADYLLEGSVRHEDDRVRVTARLIEAAGETQLWAEMYDRHLTHSLTVQSDVAGQIARALAAELVPDERGRAHSAAASAAYQAYLKGRYFWNKSEDPAIAIDQAIAYYQQALTLDASFGPAAAALARARVARAEHYLELPRHALASARDAAHRALEIDVNLYEAHLALAETQRMLDFDWGAAEASYLKALSLNPSSESAHRAYALLLSALGRHREAVRESDRAIELDPLCLVVGGAAAWVAYASGDYPAAIEIARNTIDMDPEFVKARRVLAAAYWQSGRVTEAVQELEASAALTDHPVLLGWLAHARAATGRMYEAEAIVARMLQQKGYRQQYALAIAYIGMGRIDDAFEALDVACLDRDPLLTHLAVEPRFDQIRSDPRFGALLTRMGLSTSPAPSGAGSASPRG